MSAATIVGPIGIFFGTINVNRILKTVTTTEIMAAQIVTDLNVLNKRIALNAGKIINAETSNEPTNFIAKTMITAVIMAMTRLYAPALTPVALAKFSSNVTANILL